MAINLNFATAGISVSADMTETTDFLNQLGYNFAATNTGATFANGSGANQVNAAWCAQNFNLTYTNAPDSDPFFFSLYDSTNTFTVGGSPDPFSPFPQTMSQLVFLLLVNRATSSGNLTVNSGSWTAGLFGATSQLVLPPGSMIAAMCPGSPGWSIPGSSAAADNEINMYVGLGDSNYVDLYVLGRT